MSNTGGFGRIAVPDARDESYPMRAALRPGPLPTSRYFLTGSQLPLDQGQTGTCVAHAWTGFLLAAPLMSKGVPSAFDAYRGIVLADEFSENDFEATQPNENLQSGSSVRGGAKYFQAQGRLKSYVWASSTEDMALWLLTGRGPIVLGTDWHWNMSDLDAKGVAHLGGGIADGHAYLCIGYNRLYRMFRCINSWGSSFGSNGRFWILEDEMAVLLDAQGEACAAVEQKVPKVTL
jgi:hypothetical protein